MDKDLAEVYNLISGVCRPPRDGREQQGVAACLENWYVGISSTVEGQVRTPIRPSTRALDAYAGIC